jgi:hypothetical protein
MVVAGNAWVDPSVQAIELMMLHPRKNGTTKRPAVSIRFHAHV